MKYILILLILTGLIGCSTSARFTAEQAVVVNSSSGFMLDNYVITANHVAVTNEVIVRERHKKECVGIVVARDPYNDIALIKIKYHKYYDYTIGEPRIHKSVYSVSNPMGLEFSVLQGYVQSVERIDENGAHFIQIGIDVFWGSSGSAIYNDKGQLIGMVSKVVPGTRFTFIIPGNKIHALIKKTNQKARAY